MKKIIFLFAAILLANVLNATVFYVTPEGAGNKTGEDWENALELTDTNVDLGSNGDEFWVKKGEYQVNIEYSDRKLYGGFDGTETELSQRNWALNQTIIKGVENATNKLVNLWAGAVLDGFILQDNQNYTAVS